MNSKQTIILPKITRVAIKNGSIEYSLPLVYSHDNLITYIRKLRKRNTIEPEIGFIDEKGIFLSRTQAGAVFWQQQLSDENKAVYPDKDFDLVGYLIKNAPVYSGIEIMDMVRIFDTTPAQRGAFTIDQVTAQVMRREGMYVLIPYVNHRTGKVIDKETRVSSADYSYVYREPISAEITDADELVSAVIKKIQNFLIKYEIRN